MRRTFHVLQAYIKKCFLNDILFQLLSAASRAKLSMLNTMSKIRGQVKNPGYPQAEGLLGECMSKYGRELGEDTNFGKMCLSVCKDTA